MDEFERGKREAQVEHIADNALRGVDAALRVLRQSMLDAQDALVELGKARSGRYADPYRAARMLLETHDELSRIWGRSCREDNHDMLRNLDAQDVQERATALI